MNNLQRLSNLIGLAQRAGKIISGEEMVVKAIQHEAVNIVFLANDAGPNVTKKVTDKSKYYNVEVSTVFNALELSAALGKPRKVVAVADAGFSKKMRTLME
ncbi:YlxQ-related RNA-binding protein [Streptococcus parauberis]|uniref:Ribosomal protein L7Ae n=3 Tax=Streptococcus parauberis TaxID=1348 RepID=F1Z2X3_9STRE|nr:YlxQ-related RNA-binding protein [Streptococcus parauberis]AEF24683.1 ribosomal protein L7Ae/L30e/S12e/Gadd45 family protein [Streptococcus parauberis KCTC 11537]AUT06723.1 putative ribosomal protein YlxQ [Streptococcus parauberis]EGE53699.1 ribosomal protein L7Ae [Streptococcus parauberis NCFD 2020]EMF48370.1 ribosomal protein L7Ae family protein [Streptococcus parauberis KRS-02109]EMG25363.1 ribosomal protein L7Ae family protein [Streptococcus parauberis KRS-02083]